MSRIAACEARIPTPDQAALGFSLVELLVSMVLVGLLSGLAMVTLSRRWDNEQLQATSKALASWLDERRRQGMAAMAASGTGACVISVDVSKAELNSSQASYPISLIDPTSGTSVMARNLCQTSQTLNLRAVTSNTRDLQLAINPSDLNQVLFTFRGTSPTEAEFRLSLRNVPLARCVKIAQPLGIVRLGYANPASATTCDYRNPYNPRQS